MQKSEHYQGKYAVWMWLSWAIFVVTAIASIILINKTGALDTSMGVTSRGLPPGSITVIAICVGQTIATLLVAGGFTLGNGIYNATIEDRSS